MDRIGHSKLPKSFGLKLDQVLSTVINGTTDTAVLPPCMFHVDQLIKFRANLFWGPSFLGEVQILGDSGAGGNKFIFYTLDGRRDLLVDLTTNPWRA